MENLLTPAAVRQIAQEVFREQRQDLLKSLERQFRPLWAPQPMWPEWVETTLRELIAVQERTEQHIEELTEAQKRTEARVEELAEAQKRTEEQVRYLAERLDGVEQRLDGVEQRLDGVEQRLDGVEQRLDGVEQRLDGVEQRLDGMEHHLEDVDHQLGQIGNVLGLHTEVEAQDVLLYVLEQKGYHILQHPRSLDLDGEVDIAVSVQSPEGEQIWVLTEVKARARLKNLRRWAEQLSSERFAQRLAEQGVTRPYLPYLFGSRVYQIVEEEAQRLGIGILDPDGERVVPTVIR